MEWDFGQIDHIGRMSAKSYHVPLTNQKKRKYLPFVCQTANGVPDHNGRTSYSVQDVVQNFARRKPNGCEKYFLIQFNRATDFTRLCEIGRSISIFQHQLRCRSPPTSEIRISKKISDKEVCRNGRKPKGAKTLFWVVQ